MGFLTAGVVLTALAIGGIVLYEKRANAALPPTTSTPKTINVDATAATVNNVLGNAVHANVGDTIAVQLGPPGAGLWVDQSTANLVLQLPVTGFQMKYLVKGPGTIGIGWRPGNPVTPPPAPQQIVAFAVQVP